MALTVDDIMRARARLLEDERQLGTCAECRWIRRERPDWIAAACYRDPVVVARDADAPPCFEAVLAPWLFRRTEQGTVDVGDRVSA